MPCIFLNNGIIIIKLKFFQSSRVRIEKVAFIEIKNLVHRYEGRDESETPALRGVNISVEEGEFLAIVGVNGSGKSTLAKHLNAILLPTEGSVTVDGRNTAAPAELWEIRKTVGMVFQNPDNQIIAAIVEDDVAFGPENLGIPPEEIRQRVKDALADVRMEKYRDFAPHLLSGGQKQRIAIAGALAMQTRCLVLDEPTSMLDPVGRRSLMETVKRLHREQGITVILITHFMEEAIEADRIVVLSKGQVVMEGTSREVYCREQEMKALGLDVPLAAEVAARLRRNGLKLPEDIMTDEELAAALCQ